MHREIEIFYDQYVHRSYPDEQFLLGHFDVLHWEDLKKDLSACERLQRKPFYKIALLNGTAKYHSNKCRSSYLWLYNRFYGADDTI